MTNNKRTRSFLIALVISINLFTSLAMGQYSVGQTISQSTRDKLVSFCANDNGSTSLGNLLIPGQGEATRVVWLNFFESW